MGMEMVTSRASWPLLGAGVFSPPRPLRGLVFFARSAGNRSAPGSFRAGLSLSPSACFLIACCSTLTFFVSSQSFFLPLRLFFFSPSFSPRRGAFDDTITQSSRCLHGIPPLSRAGAPPLLDGRFPASLSTMSLLFVDDPHKGGDPPHLRWLCPLPSPLLVAKPLSARTTRRI